MNEALGYATENCNSSFDSSSHATASDFSYELGNPAHKVYRLRKHGGSREL